jgi:uridine phosphorylase
VLKELGKADWLRMLNISAADIPTVLILRGTRNLETQCEIARGYFANVREVGAPNGLIESVFIGEFSGRPVGFACVYGAPMASEIVHIFGVLGTRAVIQTGCCGALAGGLAAGDLFVPSEAFCGEGAAQYYKTDGPRVAASSEILSSKTLTRHDGAPLHRGTIYTTAALQPRAKRRSPGGTSKALPPWTWKRRQPSRWPNTLAWRGRQFYMCLITRDSETICC